MIMKSVNSLIGERLKKSSNNKMTQMAERSVSGNLTTFSGVFSVTDLPAQEKQGLEDLLNEFSSEKSNIASDLKELVSITCEVKAINNQAALLHGERIKRAHKIFTTYKEGAFSAWLIATYGNRQTPYNLMQYYEFHDALPANLKTKAEEMPRQAIYTLASRNGDFDKKLTIVEKYAGETKTTLLTIIRESFPLAEKDKRRENLASSAIINLRKVCFQIEKVKRISHSHKEEIKQLLHDLKYILEKKS